MVTCRILKMICVLQNNKKGSRADGNVPAVHKIPAVGEKPRRPDNWCVPYDRDVRAEPGLSPALQKGNTNFSSAC